MNQWSATGKSRAAAAGVEIRGSPPAHTPVVFTSGFIPTSEIVMLAVTLWLNLLPAPAMQPADSLVLADFSLAPRQRWYTVNDGVMGGVSSSTMDITPDGTGVFAGNLSLDNNGGFASVRTDVRAYDLSGFTGLVLRVRGDGRTYQVRLSPDGRYRRISYSAAFETTADTWTTVVIPFTAFRPTYRGYVPRNVPPLDVSLVRELGLLLGDKREGPFRLEIERIVAVGDRNRAGR